MVFRGVTYPVVDVFFSAGIERPVLRPDGRLFIAERRLPWAVRFNSAPPMLQNIDTLAATGGRAHYRLLSLPAYAVEALPRLARAMDGGAERPRRLARDKTRRL